MTKMPHGSVPPNLPPPRPASSAPAPGSGYPPPSSPPTMPPPPPGYGPPPPAPLPPPAPGTGASSQWQHRAQASAPPASPNPYAYYPRPDKSLAVAYVLWFFFGYLGVHHFYLGKVGRGVGYLLTVAWFLIGWLVDLFTLPAQVRRINAERRVGLR